MSAENLQGVEVSRIRKGVYVVEGWTVEDVKGTTGWRGTNPHRRTRWFGSLAKARQWIKNNPGAD